MIVFGASETLSKIILDHLFSFLFLSHVFDKIYSLYAQILKLINFSHLRSDDLVLNFRFIFYFLYFTNLAYQTTNQVMSLAQVALAIYDIFNRFKTSPIIISRNWILS